MKRKDKRCLYIDTFNRYIVRRFLFSKTKPKKRNKKKSQKQFFKICHLSAPT